MRRLLNCIKTAATEKRAHLSSHSALLLPSCSVVKVVIHSTSSLSRGRVKKAHKNISLKISARRRENLIKDSLREKDPETRGRGAELKQKKHNVIK